MLDIGTVLVVKDDDDDDGGDGGDRTTVVPVNLNRITFSASLYPDPSLNLPLFLCTN